LAFAIYHAVLCKSNTSLYFLLKSYENVLLYFSKLEQLKESKMLYFYS